MIPIPRYMAGSCCMEPLHLNNLEDNNIGEIHNMVRGNSRSCLLTTFPGSTILDPLSAFTWEVNSSGGVAVWRDELISRTLRTATSQTTWSTWLMGAVVATQMNRSRGGGWRALSPGGGLIWCRSRCLDGCWAATRAALGTALPAETMAGAVEGNQRAGEVVPEADGPPTKGSGTQLAT